MRIFWIILSFLILIFIVWLIVAGVRSSTYRQTPPPAPAPTPTTPPSDNQNVPTGPQVTQVTVNINDSAYNPATVQVSNGTAVTWTNSGQTQHTVTSDNGAFDSGSLNPGSSYTFVFTQTGTFSYHCTIHPNIKGTVTVQ